MNLQDQEFNNVYFASMMQSLGAVDCFLKNLNGEELTYDDEETKIIYTDQWIIDANNVEEYE